MGTYVRRAVVDGSVICTEMAEKDGKRNSYTLFTECGIGWVDSICFVNVNDATKCFIFIRKSTAITPLRLSDISGVCPALTR